MVVGKYVILIDMGWLIIVLKGVIQPLFVLSDNEHWYKEKAVCIWEIVRGKVGG